MTDKMSKQYVAENNNMMDAYSVNARTNELSTFNNSVLPMLKQFEMFNSHDIRDYYDLTFDDLLNGYIDHQLNGVRGSLRKKNITDDAELEFRNLYGGVLIRPLGAIPEEQLQYISYDEKLGVFVCDREKWLHGMAIYATTPEEIRTYEKLKQLAALLSELNFSGMKIEQFLTTENGAKVIRKALDRQAWERLVAQSK